MMRPIAIALCMSAAALAQTAPPQDPSSLSGTVTNSITGEPILRAHVMVQCQTTSGSSSYGALTNAKGEYTVDALNAKSCSLQAERVGYVHNNGAGNYTFTPGSAKRNADIKLVPAAAINGRVLDAAGEPAAGAQIELLGNGTQTSTQADDQGRFRLHSLTPGKYRVRAKPETMPFPPEARNDGTEQPHYAATYYPNSVDAATAQRLEVGAGAEVDGIDIHLVRTPLLKVSGKVDSPAGTKNIYVSARPAQNGTGVRADGSFVIWGLDPGKYTLRAETYSNGAKTSSAPLDIEVGGANLEHLELRMVPAFAMSGQLRFEDEASRRPPDPPAGSTTPRRPAPARQLLMQSMPQENGETLQAKVGDDDSFTFDHVPPDRYRVAISWGTGFVKSVRVGMTESEGNILDLRNGPAGPVTFLLTSDFAEISGMVTDSKGAVTDATLIITRDGDRNGTRVLQSDKSGTYKTRLAPGKYRIAAQTEHQFSWGPGDPLEGNDNAVSFEVRAGDKIMRDLKVGQ